MERGWRYRPLGHAVGQIGSEASSWQAAIGRRSRSVESNIDPPAAPRYWSNSPLGPFHSQKSARATAHLLPYDNREQFHWSASLDKVRSSIATVRSLRAVTRVQVPWRAENDDLAGHR